jgi:hypothetical protein
MATTNIDTIAAKWITVVEALTPTIRPNVKFRFAMKQFTVREWATSNSTEAVMRAFDVMQTSGLVEHNFVHPAQLQRTVELTLTLAYPRMPGLYGEGLQDMEQLIHADVVQIRDALFSGTNYVSGQQAAIFDDIAPPDRDGTECWFQPIRARVIYDEAQTLS